jgi:hypothetical protein
MDHGEHAQCRDLTAAAPIAPVAVMDRRTVDAPGPAGPAAWCRPIITGPDAPKDGGRHPRPGFRERRDGSGAYAFSTFQ